MRILHIDTGAEMRGGQYQVLLLLNSLREAGHDSILLARAGGALAARAAADGFNVCPATLLNVWRHSKRSMLVHAHDARAHTLAALAAPRPIVVSRRVAFPVRRSLLSAWKYRRPARFLAVSHFVAKELQAAGIRQQKIDIVYDGVEDVNANSHWSAEWPAVALASTDPEKGRDLVTKAAELAQIPVVYSQDLKQDLRRASMLVYLTRSEGLGSATLLAMSMGVPVIASRTGGLSEVFIDGVSGLFVDNMPQDVAAAMRRIVNNPELACSLRQQGMQRIRENFTRQHLLLRTLLSYERALAL